MADYDSFQHGAVVFPLAPMAPSGSLLRDADPALFFAADFFAWCITHYVGPRLLAQAQAARAPIQQAVAMRVPYDPEPYLHDAALQFPLFAIYRKSEELENRTVVWRHAVATVEMAYVLPALTAGQGISILPMLHAVTSVLDARVEQGFDPSYAPPGGVLGDVVWSARFAGLERVELVSASYGNYLASRAEGGKALTLPAVMLETRFYERGHKPPHAFERFNGAGVTVDPVDAASIRTP